MHHVVVSGYVGLCIIVLVIFVYEDIAVKFFFSIPYNSDFPTYRK